MPKVKKTQNIYANANTHEKEIFSKCCHDAMTNAHEKRGIGTLGERTLHSVLKHFFEPDTSFHEIKLGRYVADICKDGEITEIQTRQFSSLKNKLTAYKDDYKVNVVYPIAAEKYISWINPESGEVGERHKSPKQGKPWDILYELYSLRPIMPLTDVRFTLAFCNIEEFRLLTGRSKDKKHFGASRFERIPTELIGKLTLEKASDFSVLIPDTLGDTFTATEFAKAAKMTRRRAGYAILTLISFGVIEHSETVKRTYIYKRKTL